MPKEPTENVSVSVPMCLLPILDHYCSENDLSRSQTINRAIRLYLGTKIAKDPLFWEREYQRLQNEGKI
jgi:metal-responsive CopG/Arc/MetJ family transcriptional regulator